MQTAPELIPEATLSETEIVAPWITEAFRLLRRGRPDDYKAFFRTDCHLLNVDTTKAKLRCHIISCDGNGRPRVHGLAEKLRALVIDYSIPRSELARAMSEYDQTRSAETLVALEKKAKELFADVARSGEGGEVLLYYLAERVLGIPQILCKMPLKTNPQVHYHGVDGIHAAVEPTTGKLALYWGESKLHKELGNAIKECIDSITPFLLESDGSGDRADRDLQLLRDNLDLGNPDLEQALLRFLNPTDPAFLQTEFRAICLVGYSHDGYQKHFRSNDHPLGAEVKAVFEEGKSKIQSAITAKKIDAFTIEAFCVPFPCIDEFRAAFRKELGYGT